ncbi:MAG: aminotransferase class V-fold PLP-dependent enzyme [Bacteroidetes bacterium]|nr:aminotransferase class V-fold PLP-dependent enzyme [Bacteroidota bacterium]
MKDDTVRCNDKDETFAAFEKGVHAALETYSNVHRGSGHHSVVTTHLYEQARDIVLEYLGLPKYKYIVIFCTLRREEILKVQLKPNSCQSVSSQDIGLSLGIRALVVKRKDLPKGIPFQTGGGTTRLVSPGWVIWAGAPDKFEAGTPAIINVIAFARALQFIRQYGNDAFRDAVTEKLTATDILWTDEMEKYSGKELLDALRLTQIGRNVLVPTVEGDRPFINLDNGASTPTFKPVWDAVCRPWRQSAEAQQEVVNEVRTICAGFLGAPLTDYEVIFTSNTTEAINLAAESLGRESEPGTESVLLGTLLEHSSNDLPWRMVPGFSLIRLTVDKEGFVDLNGLDTLLCAYNQKGEFGKKRIRLVAMSGASNVLGVFNNLEEISRIVHRYGARLLVDAAQLAAHRKVDMQGCGIDYLAFSAHKVYAPFGCGVLVVKKGMLKFNSGEIELIRLSGEENAGGIAALGKAMILLQRIGMDLVQEEEQALTRYLLNGLSGITGLRIYGIKDPNSPRFHQKGGVLIFSMKGIMPNRVAKELAGQGGIGVRYGCHCAHILIKHLLGVNPFFARVQGLMLTFLPKLRLPGLVRVSLGLMNSGEDVDKLIQVLGEMASKPKSDIQKQMNDYTRDSAMRVYSQS